ncbi:hypothetical protein PMSD_05435 [Paenibacillus macquariensis subsp. defensor]|nr:hypothetical protein PMSD_05435 [Paenibacillus macquariensis subsp. defensor]
MHPTIQQIIANTAIWVWILLAVLVILGVRGSQEKKVNIKRMFIAPLIFMIWGLWTITTSLPHPGFNLIFYIIFVIPGFVIGYVLNQNFQGFRLHNSIVLKKQSYLPLFVVLLNFIVKYILNVMLVFYHSTFFHAVYSSGNGLTVGMFLGGILYTSIVTSQLKNTRNEFQPNENKETVL